MNPAYSLAHGRPVWVRVGAEWLAGKVMLPMLNERSRMTTQVWVPSRKEAVRVDDHINLTGR